MDSNLENAPLTQNDPNNNLQSSQTAAANQSGINVPIQNEENNPKKSLNIKLILMLLILFCFIGTGVGIGIAIVFQNKKSGDIALIQQRQADFSSAKIQPSSVPTSIPNLTATAAANEQLNDPYPIPTAIVSASASGKLNVSQGKDMIVTRSQLMGAFSYTSLYSDGSFLNIDNLSSANSKNGCMEGKIPVSKYKELTDYIKSTGIMELKTTRNKPELGGYVCDGSSGLFIRMEGKEYDISNDCYNKVNTSDIPSKLIKLIDENTGTSCLKGGYMNISKSDTYCKEPQIKQYNNVSELPSYLSDAVNNGKDYVYTGLINEQVKLWNRQYIKLNNTCYYTFLYQFVGKNFGDYYDDYY